MDRDETSDETNRTVDAIIADVVRDPGLAIVGWLAFFSHTLGAAAIRRAGQAESSRDIGRTMAVLCGIRRALAARFGVDPDHGPDDPSKTLAMIELHAIAVYANDVPACMFDAMRSVGCEVHQAEIGPGDEIVLHGDSHTVRKSRGVDSAPPTN